MVNTKEILKTLYLIKVKHTKTEINTHPKNHLLPLIGRPFLNACIWLKLNSGLTVIFTYTNKCWQLDLVNKNYKLSYMNIIYREIMVRLMHKKYKKFLMMKHSVLLFINLALVFFFYKNNIYTVYRAIHQLFVFPYKHYTSKKKWYHYHEWKINTGKANIQKTKTKHLRKGSSS